MAVKPAVMQDSKVTPLMEQYFGIKEQYPDALLFFQVGDFYELFFDDAKQAASFLALTLTKRGKNKGEDIPLCGVPIHAVSHYLAKLVRGGFKVVMCEQLSKPQPGTVVKRGVSQVFTPGTLIDEQLLDTKSASYLLTLAPTGDCWGMVFSELLTAQLFATQVPVNALKMLETELTRFSPDEIIVPKALEQNALCSTLRGMGYPISFSQMFEQGEIATAWIEQQFAASAQVKLNQAPAVTQSLHTLYWYLHKNQPASLPLFRNIHLYEPDDYLILDAATQKNLELLEDVSGSRKHSLYAVLDRAVTSMGSRTIKKWLQRPLVQQDSIMQRQEVIKQLLATPMTLMQLEETLGQVADLERIIGRIALEKATLRDYQALKTSLAATPALKKLLHEQVKTALAQLLHEKIADLAKLHELLEASINDDALQTDLLIKRGFHHELDTLYHLTANAQQEILALEQREIAATGIGSLKVRFNNITGYYFEITQSNEAATPATYRHVQTLANRKRFTNDELMLLERNIMRAQQDTATLEQEVFTHVKKEVASYLTQLRNLAQAVAHTDALIGLARTAYDQGYVQPSFNSQRIIDLTGSRHPVVEKELPGTFIKNNVRMDDNARLIVLTGPNMGGKSTYLRQVALTGIMAQMGSFIPAIAGTLPLFDRIFTRIGSGDNVAQGKSTFLVEMEETATICTQATKNSLVILDEVGRGTSTYDGMALAQAIIEYLARTSGLDPESRSQPSHRASAGANVEQMAEGGIALATTAGMTSQENGVSCLFATHYHELTTLEATWPNIKNYHAECIDRDNAITFTHRIKAGAATKSFGIHVAQLAQLPTTIITRAQEILDSLPAACDPGRNICHPGLGAGIQAAETPAQSKHTVTTNVVDTISNLDLNTLSPREAFDLLWKLQKECK